jgi:hypothetical protein
LRALHCIKSDPLGITETKKTIKKTIVGVSKNEMLPSSSMGIPFSEMHKGSRSANIHYDQNE